MKSKLFVLAVALNLAAMAVVIAGLPAQVPIHFGPDGQADWWGSRWFYLVFAFIPPLEAAAYLIYRHLTRHNPNVRKNAAIEEKVVALTALFLAVVGWFFLLTVRSGVTRLSTSWACLIFTAVGLLMIYISNYMAKIRPNRSLGIRVRWTLRDETVWTRAHRVAGYAGVAGGAIIVAGSLMGMALQVWMAFAGFALGLIVLVAVPVVYARNLYRKLHPGE